MTQAKQRRGSQGVDVFFSRQYHASNQEATLTLKIRCSWGKTALGL